MTESIFAPVAALSVPDSAALTGRAQQALAFIQAFSIDSVETYGLAADELRAIKVRANALEEQRTALTVPLNKVLKGVNDLFRGPAELLAMGERMLKSKMLGWDQEQERIEAEARRRAEESAAAARRQLEQQAAERQREAEAQAAAAAAATAAGDQQAASLATAAAQRAQSESQAAATTAQLVVAPLVNVERAKAAGISTSTKIDFDVTSLRLLIAYIATGKVYAEGDAALAHPELINLLKADDVKLRAYVKSLGTACALPGVRVFEDRVMSARAA